MTPNPQPQRDLSLRLDGATDLPEEILKIGIDELVPFLNDFFAAMDAVRGPRSAAGDASSPGTPDA